MGSVGMKARVFSLILVCITAAFLLVGCYENASEKSDLEKARQAFAERDIGDAEMYYERYLRKNPNGSARWEVWLQLLSISRDIRQDRATAIEYLEIMLSEFAADPPKRRSIQMQLASICKETLNYKRAAEIWEIMAEDSDLPAEDQAVVFRELSLAYMRRLEFTPAEDILAQCLKLDVKADTKADCLYAMSETHMLQDDLNASEKDLKSLLALTGISAERHVMAVFSLADVYEQQNRLNQALELFESIRESYPNSKVVEVRLTSLKAKMQPKVPDVVKRPW